MHTISYKQRRFIRWLLLSLLSLVLAACSTTSAPRLDPDTKLKSATPREFAYVAKADISASATQAEVEAMYGGSTIVFKPDAGFAVLGFSEDEAALTTLATDPNENTFSTPEMSAAGVDAWAGGVDAWAGGWDAWAGGFDAWAGGWDAWAGGHGAWAGGFDAWAGGHGAWAGGATITASTSGKNLTIWDQINLPQGQRLAPNLGEGVTVAVIDTGVTSTHPAFGNANLDTLNDWDFVDNDSDAWDKWLSGANNAARGHGTAVSSIILQVAPKATILPIRVLDPEGVGDTDDIISAIDWAVQKGADIINLSVGTDVEVAALRAMLEYAASQGVFVVSSAGNENSNLTYPARWANDGSQLDPFLLGVGSVDANDLKSSFSNYGTGLELLAPGEDVHAALRQSGDVFQNGKVTGTSFAAPIAAGSLALALAEQPSRQPRADFQHKLNASAENVDLLNPAFVGSLGFGRLDVEAYMEALGHQFTPVKQALYVHDTAQLSADLPYIERLELLGFGVTPISDTLVSAASASGKDLVVVASTTLSGNVNTKLKDLGIPVVTWEAWLFDDMKMTGTASATDYGTTGAQTAVHLELEANTDLNIFETAESVRWGKPSANALVAATTPGDTSKAAFFSYEKGAGMVGMNAPARRAGLPFGDNGADLSPEGWLLFDWAVVWAVSQPVSALEVRVSQSSDDAEQRSSGDMYLNSSDLELVDDGGYQQVGIRFQNLTIPQGAIITAAYIEFETDELDSVSTSLSIRGEASNSAMAFSAQSYNISNRPTTSASVAWNNIAAWNQSSEKHQTPNLAAVVQEIVNRGGWSSGNSMAFIITGSGERTAEAYDGEAANAPLLRVEYSQ